MSQLLVASMQIVITVIAGPCGALIVLVNGLHRDKINRKKMFGYNKNALAPCAEQHSVY